MKLLREVRKLLKLYNVKPKKELGQTFLVDERVIRRLVELAEITDADVVLDIGAGFGFLTEAIAKKARDVIAVELDERIFKALQDRLGKVENVQLIHGDFLRVEIPPFTKIVSTPPYSIASPLMFKLLESDFQLAILTFQEEFARRLVAQPGTKDYGRLTVMTSCKAEVEFIEVVRRGAFYPPPDVRSAIVSLKPRKEPLLRLKDEGLFAELVSKMFAQRRRTLRKAMKMLGISLKVLEALPFAEKRVYQLTPTEFGVLANALAE